MRIDVSRKTQLTLKSVQNTHDAVAKLVPVKPCRSISMDVVLKSPLYESKGLRNEVFKVFWSSTVL